MSVLTYGAHVLGKVAKVLTACCHAGRQSMLACAGIFSPTHRALLSVMAPDTAVLLSRVLAMLHRSAILCCRYPHTFAGD